MLYRPTHAEITVYEHQLLVADTLEDPVDVSGGGDMWWCIRLHVPTLRRWLKEIRRVGGVLVINQLDAQDLVLQ